eukprot:CAMPEP_0198560572 /NCGR_PEP_ID=MMETSP1462-20131121/94141_1 /TAXON_ID=1333877 /ORGANISM="Brandtodinium nutriculum, Strain RCC3387" /LENGTH=156 /DNA_ID=CAMNT_0044291443 /DNA_START=239 /DNA_END=707 /DNA_ORIENTATION=+
MALGIFTPTPFGKPALASNVLSSARSALLWVAALEVHEAPRSSGTFHKHAAEPVTHAAQRAAPSWPHLLRQALARRALHDLGACFQAADAIMHCRRKAPTDTFSHYCVRSGAAIAEASHPIDGACAADGLDKLLDLNDHRVGTRVAARAFSAHENV